MVYMVVLIEFDLHLQAHHYHAYYSSHNHKVYNFEQKQDITIKCSSNNVNGMLMFLEFLFDT